MFLNTQSNVLYASITVSFESAVSEAHVYRLRNAVITHVGDRPDSVAQTPLTLRSYPNPFNSQTNLLFSIHTKGHVTLRIFNILGKEVVRLLDKQMSPGEFRISWGGSNEEGRTVPSGIYLARMQLGREAATIKLLVLK